MLCCAENETATSNKPHSRILRRHLFYTKAMSSDLQNEAHTWLLQNVNPILTTLVEELVVARPDDVLDFMVRPHFRGGTFLFLQRCAVGAARAGRGRCALVRWPRVLAMQRHPVPRRSTRKPSGLILIARSRILIIAFAVNC